MVWDTMSSSPQLLRQLWFYHTFRALLGISEKS